MSKAGSQAWSIYDVAALLDARELASTVVALAPPSWARLLKLLPSPSEPKRGAAVRTVVPAWFRDWLTPEHFPGWAIDADSTAVFASHRTAEVHEVVLPFTALAGGFRAPHHWVREQTLAEFCGALQRCDTLLVGSGADGIQLLNSATSIVERLRPLLVVDMAELHHAGARTQLNISELHLPEGYQLVPKRELLDEDKIARGNERFLVFSPHPLARTVSKAGGLIGNELDAQDILVRGSAVLDARTKTLVWRGARPGLALALERPGSMRGLDLYLRAPAGADFRIFINDAVVPWLRIAGGASADFIIGIDLPAAAGDELIRVLVAPIRVSTTTRFEDIELHKARFR